jgi:pimeloyl-ACP methyl ester carboxylesterase
VQEALKRAASRFIDLRGMRHHVLEWGEPGAPLVVMLHGWMDVGASFQFLVDALDGPWHVVAPDLRGFGRSEWQPQGYWFWDYVADLDALLGRLSADAPVRLVGHSLGGNVAMHYAGSRPGRVRALVSLEGFGIPFEQAHIAPRKMAAWLDALRDPPVFRPYDNLGAVADRLQKNNARLTRDKAEFLAAHWAAVTSDGRATLVSDPRHKLPYPTVYRMEDTFAIWRAITAPVLWVAAAQSHIPRWLDTHPEGEMGADGLGGVRQRLKEVPNASLALIEDAGHMLHHDQPHAVARAIAPFLRDR